LVGFTNFDWIGDPNDHKSIPGYVFSLGFRLVTWDCKNKQDLSISSIEANIKHQLMQVK
jgi:hypothetical protein